MSLYLQISRQNRLAIYRQIAEQIRLQINNGRLPEGTRLPTVRQLSADLGVTPLTIHNAYNELQADGLVESVVGRGTFVSDLLDQPPLPIDMEQPFNPETILGDIMHIIHYRTVRSLAVAIPDPDLLPIETFWESLDRQRHAENELWLYAPIEGDGKLRAAITAFLQESAIPAVPSQILVTAGAMQGLNLITRALARPGDQVLVEEPTFLGFHHLLRSQKLQPLTVPLCQDGPDLQRLESLLKRYKPRFYYTLPSFHNPTGINFSDRHRQAIVDLTRKYGTIVLEDDVYGHLAYDGPPPRPLQSLPHSDHIIYLGSFSKIAIPGLRIGYIHAPPRFMPHLTAMLRVSDLSGNPLMQRTLADFLQRGGLKRHLRRVIPVYRQRRDGLIDQLTRTMPPYVTWQKPAGGYSIWLTMPRHFGAGELYRQALDEGIGIAAGDAFFTHAQKEEHFRLCFGNLREESMRVSVAALARMIRKQVENGKKDKQSLAVKSK